MRCRLCPELRKSYRSAALFASTRSTSILTDCSHTRCPINMVADAIQKSNNEVGARLVEFSGREYMVRGKGYIKSLDDIGNIVVMTNPQSGHSGASERTRNRDLWSRDAAWCRGTGRTRRSSRRCCHHALRRKRREGD